jgi:hypothetical protein
MVRVGQMSDIFLTIYPAASPHWLSDLSAFSHSMSLKVSAICVCTSCRRYTVVIDGIAQPGKKVHPQTRKEHMFGAGPRKRRKRRDNPSSGEASDEKSGQFLFDWKT